MKAPGIEFKAFYNDPKYWPEKSDTYHEDVVFTLNGDPMPEDFDPGKVADSDMVGFEGGIIMNSPLYKEGEGPTIETYFRRWKREQTKTRIVIECDISKVAEIEKAVRAAGGKILK